MVGQQPVEHKGAPDFSNTQVLPVSDFSVGAVHSAESHVSLRRKQQQVGPSNSLQRSNALSTSTLGLLNMDAASAAYEQQMAQQQLAALSAMQQNGLHSNLVAFNALHNPTQHWQQHTHTVSNILLKLRGQLSADARQCQRIKQFTPSDSRSGRAGVNCATGTTAALHDTYHTIADARQRGANFAHTRLLDAYRLF